MNMAASLLKRLGFVLLVLLVPALTLAADVTKARTEGKGAMPAPGEPQHNVREGSFKKAFKGEARAPADTTHAPRTGVPLLNPNEGVIPLKRPKDIGQSTM